MDTVLTQLYPLSYLTACLLKTSKYYLLTSFPVFRVTHFQQVSTQHASPNPDTLTNSVVLVRKRTIPTERPQPAGEISANFSC
jgi:hypothetical protein